tara:strand:- start:2042 stop:2434 length:393 start_codon:yes stop_codon:yes gene_type:complete
LKVLDYLIKNNEVFTKLNLPILVTNFLSETKHSSELERVYYEKCKIKNKITPVSSNYVFSRSSHILNEDLSQLHQTDPNFITQFEIWFQKKISEIDYLKSKKLDQKIGSNQMKTISAVLNELERGLGLIE